MRTFIALVLLVLLSVLRTGAGEIEVNSVVVPNSPEIVVDNSILRRRTAADLDWPLSVTRIAKPEFGLDTAPPLELDADPPVFLKEADVLPIYRAIRHYDAKLSELGETPAAADWLKLRGDCYLHSKALHLAAADYLQAHQLKPDNERYALKAIEVCQESQQYREALSICDKLLEKNPTLAIAHYWRGRALSGQNEFQGAIAALDKAILLDPQRAASYGRRSLIHLFVRDFVRAARDARQAVELDPSEVNYFMLAAGHANCGDLETAIADLRKGLEVHPQSQMLLTYYVSILIGTDREASVEEEYRKQPLAADLICMFQGVKYSADKRHDDAIQVLTAGIARNSMLKLMLLGFRSQAYFDRGDHELALADVNEMLEGHPGQAGALSQRGCFELKQGDVESAEADFTAALRSEPTQAAALRGLAEIYEKRGDFVEARRLLAEVQQQDPEDASASLAAAKLELAAGQPVAAIAKCTESVLAAELAERNSLQGIKLTNRGIEISYGYSSKSPAYKRFRATVIALAYRGYAQSQLGNYRATLADAWRICTLPVVNK